MTFEKRLDILIANINQPVSQFFAHVGYDYLSKTKAFTKQKGVLGDMLEEGVTGKDKTTQSIADLTKYNTDLKTLGLVSKQYPSGWGFNGSLLLPRHKEQYNPKENLRLDNIPSNIWQTPFEESALLRKAKMLGVLYMYCEDKPPHEQIIMGIVGIDLTLRLDDLKADYLYVANMYAAGRANELRSSMKQPDYTCRLVAPYSNATTAEPKPYLDANGISRTAKGKAFYLYKDQIVDTCRVFEDAGQVLSFLTNNNNDEHKSITE